MESEEYGDDSKAEPSSEGIRFVHIALLETIQKMGYDKTQKIER